MNNLFQLSTGSTRQLNKHHRYPISETPITSFTSSDRSSIHIWTSPFSHTPINQPRRRHCVPGALPTFSVFIPTHIEMIPYHRHTSCDYLVDYASTPHQSQTPLQSTILDTSTSPPITRIMCYHPHYAEPHLNPSALFDIITDFHVFSTCLPPHQFLPDQRLIFLHPSPRKLPKCSQHTMPKLKDSSANSFK